MAIRIDGLGVVLIGLGVVLMDMLSRCDTAMVVHKATAKYATPGGGALCNQNLTAARSLFEKAAAMHPLNYTYARCLPPSETEQTE